MAEEIVLNEKLQKIAESIESLTVLEMADLAKYLEEKFGVSAMPMMAAAPMGQAVGGAEAAPAEEKTSFTDWLATALKLVVLSKTKPAFLVPRAVFIEVSIAEPRVLIAAAPSLTKSVLSGVVHP